MKFNLLILTILLIINYGKSATSGLKSKITFKEKEDNFKILYKSVIKFINFISLNSVKIITKRCISFFQIKSKKLNQWKAK